MQKNNENETIEELADSTDITGDKNECFQTITIKPFGMQNEVEILFINESKDGKIESSLMIPDLNFIVSTQLLPNSKGFSNDCCYSPDGADYLLKLVLKFVFFAKLAVGRSSPEYNNVSETGNGVWGNYIPNLKKPLKLDVLMRRQADTFNNELKLSTKQNLAHYGRKNAIKIKKDIVDATSKTDIDPDDKEVHRLMKQLQNLLSKKEEACGSDDIVTLFWQSEQSAGFATNWFTNWHVNQCLHKPTKMASHGGVWHIAVIEFLSDTITSFSDE